MGDGPHKQTDPALHGSNSAFIACDSDRSAKFAFRVPLVLHQGTLETSRTVSDRTKYCDEPSLSRCSVETITLSESDESSDSITVTFVKSRYADEVAGREKDSVHIEDDEDFFETCPEVGNVRSRKSQGEPKCNPSKFAETEGARGSEFSQHLKAPSEHVVAATAMMLTDSLVDQPTLVKPETTDSETPRRPQLGSELVSNLFAGSMGSPHPISNPEAAYDGKSMPTEARSRVPTANKRSSDVSKQSKSLPQSQPMPTDRSGLEPVQNLNGRGGHLPIGPSVSTVNWGPTGPVLPIDSPKPTNEQILQQLYRIRSQCDVLIEKLQSGVGSFDLAHQFIQGAPLALFSNSMSLAERGSMPHSHQRMQSADTPLVHGAGLSSGRKSKPKKKPGVSTDDAEGADDGSRSPEHNAGDELPSISSGSQIGPTTVLGDPLVTSGGHDATDLSLSQIVEKTQSFLSQLRTTAAATAITPSDADSVSTASNSRDSLRHEPIVEAPYVPRRRQQTQRELRHQRILRLAKKLEEHVVANGGTPISFNQSSEKVCLKKRKKAPPKDGKPEDNCVDVGLLNTSGNKAGTKVVAKVEAGPLLKKDDGQQTSVSTDPNVGEEIAPVAGSSQSTSVISSAIPINNNDYMTNLRAATSLLAACANTDNSTPVSHAVPNDFSLEGDASQSSLSNCSDTIYDQHMSEDFLQPEVLCEIEEHPGELTFSADQAGSEGTVCSTSDDASMPSASSVIPVGGIRSSQGHEDSIIPEDPASTAENQEAQEFPCEMCDYVAKNKSRLREHARNMHNPNGPVPCKYCTKIFKCSYRMLRHARYAHPEHVTVYVCDKCPLRTTNKTVFDTHLLRHAGVKTHECPHCEYKTSHPRSLKMHILTHTGEKPYACNLCDYRATQRGHLNHHVKLVHFKTKDYKCEVCGTLFGLRNALKRHIRTQHMDRRLLKTHKCEHCSYEALHLERLRDHMRTHSGEKPFACDLCEYRTSSRNSLAKHAKIHLKKAMVALQRTTEESGLDLQDIPEVFAAKEALQKPEQSVQS